MTRPIPLIAIIGRTNVGKSKLFNVIVGKDISIVKDEHGVTRDRIYRYVERFGFGFTLVDTGGLLEENSDEIARSVRAQAEVAIEEADLILAVVDGLEGPHALDALVADLLRRSEKPVIWVVNKSESSTKSLLAPEFYALGIDEFIQVSAVHRQGIDELGERMRTVLGIPKAITEELEEWEVQPESEEIIVPQPSVIRVAIVGKPNVGKSTLVNRLLGQDRLVTSEIPGTTRDAIDISLTRDGEHFVLVDTAGLRRKSRVEDLSVERASNLRTMRALSSCDVAVLMMDATDNLPSDQDLKIAELANERGRPLILVVNKWDAVEKDHTTVKEFEEVLRRSLHFVNYAPILFVSGLTGRRAPAILSTVSEVHRSAQERIPTSKINVLITKAFDRNPPPVYRGEPVKFFFATQVTVSPPSIVVVVNHPRRLSAAYQRYLKRLIREEYPFPGTDIRLILKKRGVDDGRAAA